MSKKTEKSDAQKQLDMIPTLAGQERFTVVLKDAHFYGLLSIHEFEGFKYQVVAVMEHKDGVAVEFVMMK